MQQSLMGKYPGVPAMTSRGLKEKDLEQIADFLEQAVNITLSVQKEYGKLLKDFNKGLVDNKEIAASKEAVESYHSNSTRCESTAITKNSILVQSNVSQLGNSFNFVSCGQKMPENVKAFETCIGIVKSLIRQQLLYWSKTGQTHVHYKVGSYMSRRSE